MEIWAAASIAKAFEKERYLMTEQTKAHQVLRKIF